MKDILISIKPEWVEKILNGEKTIEIRKTMPKCELPCKVYIYCTKGNNSLYAVIKKGEEMPYSDGQIAEKHEFITIPKTPIERWGELGKVVAEFTLNKAEPFSIGSWKCDDIQKSACLSYEQVVDYFYKPEELDGSHIKWGYAWHIDNLKIYDEPKELSEFYGAKECPYKDWGDVDNLGCWEIGCEMFSRGECRFGHLRLDRPPQSWCYVEKE